MPANRKLISDLKNALSSHANPSNAVQMQRYMKSSMAFYGVKAPVLKAICKEVFQTHPLDSFERWRDTVLMLWRTATYREERHAAIALCDANTYRSFQTLDALPCYEEMIVTGAWWDYVDAIASHRIVYLLQTYPKPMATSMKLWSRDGDLWKRRAAILSQLNQKEKTNVPLLYACIQPSLGSDEFFLQKAIGWALRSYAWFDVDEVRQYVEANKHKLSRLSQREALKNQDKARLKSRQK